MKHSEGDPLMTIEKSRVLQDSRCFDAKQLDLEECRRVMSRTLFLLNQGETLSETESTELFFRVTKMFQSSDLHLRRLLYLVLKELTPKENEVFIVTSSLVRDVSGTNEFYRANALRVLAKTLDLSMLTQLERSLKTAIIDKNESIAASALLLGVQLGANLGKGALEIIKRWVPEVQERLTASNFNVHYHGLLLIYEIKRNDPVSLTKLLVSMTRSNLKSPLSHCQLIRFIKETMLRMSLDSSIEHVLLEYLEGCLHRSQDMIVLEAAKAMCEIRTATPKDIASALTVLQLFLASTRSCVKFAAIKALNKVAVQFSKYLVPNYSDFEPLINDPNRCIATLAISTMLKISSEANVDQLLKQIQVYIAELSDDFKVDIVSSIKALCVRMPGKAGSLLNFVASCLKQDGSFQLKQAMVECMLGIMREVPECQEISLLHLAEFIEDCPFDILQCRVLHLLGELGPKMSHPSSYIRFIYNRLILEKGMIRAAAVNALARFGQIAELKKSIGLLLRRCLEDRDDEVRERAAMNLKSLETGRPLTYALPMSLLALEAAVQKALQGSSLDLSQAPETQLPAASVPETLSEPVSLVDDIQTNPQFAGYGPIVKTSGEQFLTEKTAEIIVSYVKYVYEHHVVLQFSVKNTIPGQVMESVGVNLHLMQSPFAVLLSESDSLVSVPCARIAPDQTGTLFFSLRKPSSTPVSVLPASLKFQAVEYEGEEVVASYEDEYPVENVELTLADFLQ